jgi:hypothetical protein
LNNYGFFDTFSEETLNRLYQESKNKFITDVRNKNSELISSGKYYQVSDIKKVIQKVEYGDNDTEVMIDIIYKKLIMKHLIIHFYEYQNDLEKFKEQLITDANAELARLKQKHMASIMHSRPHHARVVGLHGATYFGARVEHVVAYSEKVQYLDGVLC